MVLPINLEQLMSHGAALGDNEIKKTREALGWDYDPFEIPKKFTNLGTAKTKEISLKKEWNSLLEQYKKRLSSRLGRAR